MKSESYSAIIDSMMDPERSLVPSEITQQLDQLKGGGLIERAVSAPQQRMDLMIQGHLNRVALLQMRGDTLPERPMYIFNPDSRLLISYSFRRYQSPSRSGLFAEITELDEEGKPRHGVSVVNPFQSQSGFIEVEVGKNSYGFAKSSVEMKLDIEDLLLSIPPNIDTTELISMLSTEAIPDSENLTDFLSRTDSQRDALRRKAAAQERTRFVHTVQGFTKETNPYVHLIIADGDVTPIEAVSREVGLFPIHITVEDVIKSMRDRYSHIDRQNSDEDLNFLLFSFKTSPFLALRELRQQTDYTPGFITFNYDNSEPHIRIPSIENPGWNSPRPYRNQAVFSVVKNLLYNNPVFSALLNEGFPPEFSEGGRIDKVSHGHYEQAIDSNDSEKMKEYTDWLRKVKLDMALSLYLRGLNQLI